MTGDAAGGRFRAQSASCRRKMPLKTVAMTWTLISKALAIAEGSGAAWDGIATERGI